MPALDEFLALVVRTGDIVNAFRRSRGEQESQQSCRFLPIAIETVFFWLHLILPLYR